MPRFAEPVSIRSLKKVGPRQPAAAPRRTGPPHRSATWHALQFKAARSQAVPPAKTESGAGLPMPLRTGIERLSGLAMDDVRVHRNSAAPARLGAYAFAQGRDIHLGPGQERHLPHEAWHVVQQAQGRVKPTMQMHGAVPINDDSGLEREADLMGDRALSLADSAAPAQRVAAPARRTAAGETAQAVMQCLRFSNTNSFYGAPRHPDSISQQQAAALAPLLPTTSFSTHVAMVNLPGEGLLWVEILNSDANWIASKAGRFQARDSAEASDDDHGSDSPAPEEPIAWSDLTPTGLKRLPDPVLFEIFKNLALPLLRNAGQRIPNHLVTIYYQWKFGGVHTRSQLCTLLGIQAKSQSVVQMARTGNTYSYNTGYTGNHTGTNYADVVYYRDTGGNIDFSVNPATIIASYNILSGDSIAASSIAWSDPLVSASKVQMSTDLTDKKKGVMPSGKAVSLPKASRSQHFAIADMLYPNARTGKLTWHHLNNPYEMVLVDMRVHAKHGHNGGVHLWK